MFDGARGDAESLGNIGDFPCRAVLAGGAEQQCPRVNELGSRRFPVPGDRFEFAALFFGKGDFVTWCHANQLGLQKQVSQYTKYIMLHDTSDTVWDLDTRQPGAIRKRARPDAGYAFGDDYARQLAAICERTLSNTRHGVGNGIGLRDPTRILNSSVFCPLSKSTPSRELNY